MRELELARFIRDDVLRVQGEAERSVTFTSGHPHGCWRFQANGWRATVANHWEIACAAGPRAIDTERRDWLLSRDRVTVFVGIDELAVMILDYGDDPRDDALVEFHSGDWERHFAARRRVLELLDSDHVPLRAAPPTRTMRPSFAMAKRRGGSSAAVKAS